MKSYKELLKTETYWLTKIQNDLFNAVEEYLETNKMTRTQFAKQLGVSKGYISQVLNGEFNHRLAKLIEIALAIGKAPVLDFEDLNSLADKESKGMIRRNSSYVPRAPFSVTYNHKTANTPEPLEKKSKRQPLPDASSSGKEGSWEMKRPIFYNEALLESES
jgi:transcriptional regulator with XRE-family HTH domain